jgi:hypothetical protein
MSKLGTEKIEAIHEAAKKLVIAGKKIKADGKVDMMDFPHVLALVPELPAIIAAFTDVLGAFDEIKDLDVAEFIAQVQSVNAKIKEIEKA